MYSAETSYFYLSISLFFLFISLLYSYKNNREKLFKIDYFFAKIRFNAKYVYLCEIYFDEYDYDYQISYLVFQSNNILIRPISSFKKSIKIPYEKVASLRFDIKKFDVNDTDYKKAKEIMFIYIVHLLEKFPDNNYIILRLLGLNKYNNKAFKKANIFEIINQKIPAEKIITYNRQDK